MLLVYYTGKREGDRDHGVIPAGHNEKLWQYQWVKLEPHRQLCCTLYWPRSHRWLVVGRKGGGSSVLKFSMKSLLVRNKRCWACCTQTKVENDTRSFSNPSRWGQQQCTADRSHIGGSKAKNTRGQKTKFC